MDCNVNFKGRLVVNGMTKNKTRWENIAKIFKEETKGINYESRVFDDNGTLEIFVNRFDNPRRKFDCIDDLTTREAVLSKKGTEALLSQPDNVIAKILAKHMQFVKKLDDSYKQAETMFEKVYNKVCNIFDKNGFDTECVNEMFEDVSTRALSQEKVASDYHELKGLIGFQDAEISHVDYIE